MLNPLNFLSKFIKSSNQKELDRILKIVDKVNSFEDKIKTMLDENFPEKTLELKKQITQGVKIKKLDGNEKVVSVIKIEDNIN